MSFFIRAIEEFIRRYPQHANFKRPVDSHVALHVAAVNNRFDVVSFLAQTVELHVFEDLLYIASMFGTSFHKIEFNFARGMSVHFNACIQHVKFDCSSPFEQ